MDASNITSIIISSINTIFSKIFSSLDNNLYSILDELTFIDYDILNDKYFEDCRECHIEPDWLLIYKYIDDKLILLLMKTVSHSELFKK